MASRKHKTFRDNAPPDNIIKEWHSEKNVHVNLLDLTPGSHKKVWWQCSNNQSHEWETTIYHRLIHLRGCPFCSNQKISLDNCLLTCHPEVAREWHPTKNGTLTPYDVTGGSGKKVWWRCGNNSSHEWYGRIDHRTCQNSGCPMCVSSKGENKIKEYLDIRRIPYKTQVKFNNCKYKKHLPFDFCIFYENKQYIVEYQGIQHYSSKHGGFGGKEDSDDKFKELVKRDKIKKKWCKNNSMPFLAIPYYDYENIDKLMNEFLSFKGNLCASI